MQAFGAQKYRKAIEEEKEAPTVELKDGDEKKVEMILDLELWEDEKPY